MAKLSLSDLQHGILTLPTADSPSELSSPNTEQEVPSLTVSTETLTRPSLDPGQGISKPTMMTAPASLFSNGRERAYWAFAYATSSADFFGTLPTELLEKIFIRSENLDMILINRQFYLSLRSEVARLRFCAHVFYHGRDEEFTPLSGRRERSKPAPTKLSQMAILQTRILRQKWFTASFAKRLENEVARLQRQDYRELDHQTRRRLATSGRYHSVSRSVNKIHLACGVTWTPRLVRGQWTDDELDPARRVAMWGLSILPDETMLLDATKDAIVKGNNSSAALDFLIRHSNVELEFEPEMLKLAIYSSCDISVVKRIYRSLDPSSRGASIRSIFDAEICKFAKENAAKGDQRGQELEIFIISALFPCYQYPSQARLGYEGDSPT